MKAPLPLISRYRIVRQFIKFGLTGTVGATVDFGTYNILTRLVGWTTVYDIGRTKLIAANLVSVFLAILSNFLLNKYWTFRDPSQNVTVQGTSYFILNLITFTLNQLLTSFFIFHVALFDIFGTQQDNAAKVASVGFILFINFFGSKFIIFRKRPAPALEQTSSFRS